MLFGQLIAGSTLSSTVTVAVQLELLPLLSVTVSVTVLAPTSEQVKPEVLTVLVSMPQASVEPPSTSAAVMVAEPLASRSMVMFWQTAAGRVLSSMVTVAEQVEVLPAASLAESTTVLAPTLEQSKEVTSRLMLVMPQLSELLSSMSATVIPALPEASRATVGFRQEKLLPELMNTYTRLTV